MYPYLSMHKKLLIINLLFFFIYFQLVCEHKANAAIVSSDFEKVSLRVGRHAEFMRIVLTVPSEEITKNVSASFTDSKLIKVAFLQPITLTFTKSGAEQNIPKGDGFIEITKEIKILAGTNFCLIQVEKIDNYKLSKMNAPPRIVIDAYILQDKQIAAPAKPSAPVLEVPLKRLFSSYVIDPGHGGYDKGIYDENNREKDIVLNISKEIAQTLLAGGKKAFLTRKADQRVSIKERIALANARSPDIFISIHMSSQNEGLVYTYAPKNDNPSDDPRDRVVTDVAANLINNIKKDLGLNIRHERLPLPLLKQVRAPAVLIELPHFRSFSYDKKKSEALIKAIIKGLALTSPAN